MEADEARAVLGVGAGDGWEVVRAAYRRLMREVHPDVAGAARTRQAARINQAYVVLTRARRAAEAAEAETGGTRAPGRPASGRTSSSRRSSGTSGPSSSAPGSEARPPGSSASTSPPGAAGGPGAGAGFRHEPVAGRDDGMDLVVMPVHPVEAFTRLLAAGHRIGDVGYVERGSGIFEVIVRHEDEVCSLLVMVEPGETGTEVLIALEALERVASLPPTAVVRSLLAAMPGGP